MLFFPFFTAFYQTRMVLLPPTSVFPSPTSLTGLNVLRLFLTKHMKLIFFRRARKRRRQRKKSTNMKKRGQIFLKFRQMILRCSQKKPMKQLLCQPLPVLRYTRSCLQPHDALLHGIHPQKNFTVKSSHVNLVTSFSILALTFTV